MKAITLSLATLIMLSVVSETRADLFGTDQNRFEIEFVTIGDPGNPPDLTGHPIPAGSVPYVYNMAKHEISRSMVADANASGDLGITMHDMAFLNGGPRPNMPATGVSWNEAARFVNWLNTSQGYPEAYKFSTQPGDADYQPNEDIQLWTFRDPGYSSYNVFRNQQANYFLPSMDEWYKAAYYDPNANNGDGIYWNFPVGSHDEPIPVSGGTRPGTAVHSQSLAQGPADIKNAGGLSPYGVMGMGGNVWEWEETEVDLVNDDTVGLRGVRGGRWYNRVGALNVFYRDDDDVPSNEMLEIGFRVASRLAPESKLEFDVSPGFGRFPASSETDSYLNVQPIQDGMRISALTAGPRQGSVPPLTVGWDASPGQWYRFEAEVESLVVGQGDSEQRDLIGELDSDVELSFGTSVLAPNPDGGRYEFTWQPAPYHRELGDVSVTWNFTAIPIDAPVPGDANADGKVNFFDLLTVTQRFGDRGLGWSGGDFDQNGRTGFEDFLTLSNNFGAGTASAELAAVPEPSSKSLLWTVALLPLLRRRQRNA